MEDPMKKLAIGLLIVAAVLVLAVVAAGTFYYVKIYPITSPLAAVVGGARLEERLLENRDPFVAPVSGELTAEEAAKFVAVEEAVQERVGRNLALLADTATRLRVASRNGELSLKEMLPGLGAVKKVYLQAKMAQVEAMNKAGFSKAEFEWVRQELYHAAALPLSQLDVSNAAASLAGGVASPVPSPTRTRGARVRWRPGCASGCRSGSSGCEVDRRPRCARIARPCLTRLEPPGRRRLVPRTCSGSRIRVSANG
jgi:hypothetical protein